MDCDICMEAFNGDDRRPKFLPCGHTFCLLCLEKQPSNMCPVDRKKFRGEACDQKDNFKVMQDFTKPMVAISRLWCRRCKKEASENCVEEHAVCGLKTARAEQMQPRVEALHESESHLSALQTLLEGAAQAVLASGLDGPRDRLQTEAKLIAEARKALFTAVTAEDWERIKETDKKPDFVRDAARLVRALQEFGSRCSVSVAVDAAEPLDVVRGSVSAEDPVARMLHGRLLCAGALQWTEPRGRDVAEPGALQQQAVLEGGEDVQDPSVPAADSVTVKTEPVDADEAATTTEECVLWVPKWSEASNEAAELCSEEMALRMRVGSRVAPGRDWSRRSQVHRRGTVLALNAGRAGVRWDGSDIPVSSHRMGKDGEYHLTLLPTRTEVPSFPRHGEGLPKCDHVLSVLAISTGQDIKKTSDLLTSGTLEQVRTLVGLHCAVSAPWSRLVLERVADRLEALALVSPAQEHLAVVRAMPRLRALHVDGDGTDWEGGALPGGLEELYLPSVTALHMEQVKAMPLIRRLELHCPFDRPVGELSFPRVSPPSGLRWLRVGVYPLSSALSLVRAHAATLAELELVASTSDPYGCPDLARELRHCHLRELRRLLLLRESHWHLCHHDYDECRQQKLALWEALVDEGVVGNVLCSVCDVPSAAGSKLTVV